VKDDPQVLRHLPDPQMAKKQPDREFCYNVVNTLREDFMNQVIDNALTIRMQAPTNPQADN